MEGLQAHMPEAGTVKRLPDTVPSEPPSVLRSTQSVAVTTVQQDGAFVSGSGPASTSLGLLRLALLQPALTTAAPGITRTIQPPGVVTHHSIGPGSYINANSTGNIATRHFTRDP